MGFEPSMPVSTDYELGVVTTNHYTTVSLDVKHTKFAIYNLHAIFFETILAYACLHK